MEMNNEEFIIFSEPVEKKVEEEFDPFEDSFYIDQDKQVNETSVFEDSFYIAQNQPVSETNVFEDSYYKEKKEKDETFNPFEEATIENKTMEMFSPFEEKVEEKEKEIYSPFSEENLPTYLTKFENEKMTDEEIDKRKKDGEKSSNDYKNFIESSRPKSFIEKISVCISNIQKATEDSFYKVVEVLSMPYYVVRHNVKKIWRKLTNKIEDIISKKQLEKNVKKIQKEKLKKLSAELKKQNKVVKTNYEPKHLATKKTKKKKYVPLHADPTQKITILDYMFEKDKTHVPEHARKKTIADYMFTKKKKYVPLHAKGIENNTVITNTEVKQQNTEVKQQKNTIKKLAIFNILKLKNKSYEIVKDAPRPILKSEKYRVINMSRNTNNYKDSSKIIEIPKSHQKVLKIG